MAYLDWALIDVRKDVVCNQEEMQYVNRVRKYVYEYEMKLEDAVERAVTECIRENILKDFLIENRAEVIAMSIFEFDEEREMKLIREEEYQSGLEDGIKKGEYITLYNLYKDNKISLETALQSISMSKEEFFEVAKKYRLN